MLRIAEAVVNKQNTTIDSFFTISSDINSEIGETSRTHLGWPEWSSLNCCCQKAIFVWHADKAKKRMHASIGCRLTAEFALYWQLKPNKSGCCRLPFLSWTAVEQFINWVIPRNSEACWRFLANLGLQKIAKSSIKSFTLKNNYKHFLKSVISSWWLECGTKLISVQL